MRNLEYTMSKNYIWREASKKEGIIKNGTIQSKATTLKLQLRLYFRPVEQKIKLDRTAFSPNLPLCLIFFLFFFNWVAGIL